MEAREAAGLGPIEDDQPEPDDELAKAKRRQKLKLAMKKARKTVREARKIVPKKYRRDLKKR